MTAQIVAPVTLIPRVIVANVTTPQGPTVVPGQVVRNSNSTFQLTDAQSYGKHVYHSGAATCSYTIPANRDAPFAVGDGLLAVNGASAGTLTVKIDTSDSDVMVTDGTGSTASITLAAGKSVYLLKVAAKEWRAYPGN